MGLNYIKLAFELKDGWKREQRASEAIIELITRCTRLEEAREHANEACAKWEARAEQAEKELDEAIEVICSHCTNFPCKTDACPWWRGKKDDNK